MNQLNVAGGVNERVREDIEQRKKERGREGLYHSTRRSDERRRSPDRHSSHRDRDRHRDRNRDRDSERYFLLQATVN